MNGKMTNIVAAFGTAILLGFGSGTATAGGLLDVSFDPTKFSNGLVIDNPYWPLLPSGVLSRSFTYIGETEDECVIDVISATAGDMKILGGDDNPYYAGFVAQVILDKEWVVEDVAKVLKTNASVSIEDGHFAADYEGCRKVKEWTALEPGDSVEHKYYCPGIDGPGLVLINGLTGGPIESEILIEMTSK